MNYSEAPSEHNNRKTVILSIKLDGFLIDGFFSLHFVFNRCGFLKEKLRNRNQNDYLNGNWSNEKINSDLMVDQEKSSRGSNQIDLPLK